MSEPRITVVTVTTSSQTPEELIAAAYPTSDPPDQQLLEATRLISFVPFADGIFSSTRADATVNDVPLGMNTLTFQARRREISGDRGIEFIAASSVQMAIIESSSEDVAPLTGQFSAASSGGTAGLTFETAPTKINQAVAGIVDLGVVANATDVVRIHEIAFTMRGQGTATIGYDDDGAGTNAVALEGPMSLGAGAGFYKQWNADPRSTFATIADATPKHMTVTFTVAGGDGYARLSKGPA